MKAKSIASIVGVAVVLGLLLSVSGPFAQEKKADGAKPAAQKRERAQPRGRLPNFYRQVVSPDQREKIYAIQKSYESQINDLEKQLADVVAKRDAEVEAVLTPEQKVKVQKLNEEARLKREEARKKAAAATSDAAADK